MLEDQCGRRLGKLLILRKMGLRDNDVYYECICNCRNIIEVSSHDLLMNGKKDCGCIKEDIIGKRFGKWVVLKSDIMRNYVNYCKCKCDCGTIREINTYNLTNGTSKSCGCHTIERITKHGLSGTRIYSAWTVMKASCYNPASKGYHNYGALGVTICDEWKDDLIKFYNDMGDIPEMLTINLINPYGDYKKSNCTYGLKGRIAVTRKRHSEFNPELHPEHLTNEKYYNLNQDGIKVFTKI